MIAIDQSLFWGIYNLAGKSAGWDFLIVFFGEYFFYIVLAVFAYFAYCAHKRGGAAQIKLYGWAIISAPIARFGVAEIIRLFYYRLRPYAELSLPHLIADSAYSFPSGHTIFMFALATTTYFFNKKLAYFLFAAGILIGLARVAGAVHYPSDILGGAVLGILTALVLRAMFKRGA